MTLARSTLLVGPFSALLQKARRRLELREQTFKTDYLQQLRFFVDETITDSERRSVYHDAIHGLNQTYGVFYEVEGDKDLVDIFSWIVFAKDFLTFVADEEEEALVVLSYFCVLLHKLPCQWWLNSWVNHIMTRIYWSVGEVYHLFSMADGRDWMVAEALRLVVVYRYVANAQQTVISR